MIAPVPAGKLPAALLFDLDGTLLDSAPDLAIAVNQMLCDLGYRAVTEESVRSWVGNGAHKLVGRALANGQGLSESAVEPQQLADALNRFMEHYQHCYCGRSQLYPGVLEALAYWREEGVAMACVTNKPARFTDQLLEYFGLSAFITVSVSGDSLPQKKPAPEPLFHACEQLAVNPSAALMIGDSINDVLAARAAGMAVVCVDYGYNYGEPIASALPDRVIASLAELIG